MSRFTVTVDDELMEEACEVLEVASKSEAIRRSLRDVIRRKRLRKVLDRKGTVQLDVDQESLEELRRTP